MIIQVLSIVLPGFFCNQKKHIALGTLEVDHNQEIREKIYDVLSHRKINLYHKRGRKGL